MSAEDKKVRKTGAGPDAKTLKEPTTIPTLPDGEAARRQRERRQQQEAVPRAPLDLGDDLPRRKR